MRLSVLLLVLAAGLLWAEMRAQPEAPPAPSLVVRGRVVAASTGHALARARVGVVAEGADVDAVLTDNEGRFAARLRMASGITLTITKAGYAAARVRLSRRAVAAGAIGEYALDVGAAIGGRVVEGGGAPAVGVALTVRRVDGPDPGGAPKAWPAETDDRGEYRIGGLAPGRYAIAVARVPPSRELRMDVTRGEHISDANLVLDPPAPGPEEARGAATLGGARGRAAVHGRVVSESGEPLGDAVVQLRGPGTAVRQGTADADGGFMLSGVPAGSYTLRGAKAGYVALEYGQRRATERGKTIVLREGETLRGVTLVLPRGSVIAGTVVDEQGEPVEGAAVRALQVRHAAGRTAALQPPGVRERRTDDRGQFRLFGLLPGTFLLLASVDAAISTPESPVGRGYAPSFYPGTADIREAWRARLDMQRDVFGAHIVLAPSPAARVAGHAFASSGRALGGAVLLAASQRSGAIALEPRTAPIAADGSFLLTNVPPGDYVVQAIGTGGDEASPEFAMQFLTITDGDPAPLTLTASRGATIEGRVVIEGSTGTGSAYALMPFPADFDYAPLIGRGETLTVDPPGWFKASGLTGPRRLVLSDAPAGWFLKSVTIGGRDATDVPFDFGLRHTWLDARLVIATTGPAIAGTVTDEGAAPASDYTIVVFPTDRSKWFAHSRFLKFARPSQDGGFEVSGMPPAEYFVAAVETLDATPGAGDWQDPAVLGKLAAGASRVTVSERDRLNLSLQLVRR